MRSIRAVPVIFVAMLPFFPNQGTANPPAKPSSPPIVSYLPHWVVRDGEVSDSLLEKLAPGTVIGAHHRWEFPEFSRILDYPDKRFRIAWYAEANVQETDDPTPAGTSVAMRIAEAKSKQTELKKHYPEDRFANMIELDGSREKRDGHLSGQGNGRADWLKDARAVHAAGFRYVAKSPTAAQLRELRATLGKDFVQHVVFEDVTAGPGAVNRGYGNDAAALGSNNERLTLIMHEGAYGGFPGTTLVTASAVTKSRFSRHNIEVYWGRSSADAGVVKIQSFASVSDFNQEAGQDLATRIGDYELGAATIFPRNQTSVRP